MPNIHLCNWKGVTQSHPAPATQCGLANEEESMFELVLVDCLVLTLKRASLQFIGIATAISDCCHPAAHLQAAMNAHCVHALALTTRVGTTTQHLKITMLFCEVYPCVDMQCIVGFIPTKQA